MPTSPLVTAPRQLRRRASLAVALLSIAIVSLASAQNMFRGDAAHSGLYGTEGPKTLKNVKWTFKTGGSVVSSPVIAGSTLYIGSDDKTLYALDLASGREKWKFASGGPIRSTPAAVGDSVYFGSYDGVFYSLEAATGKVLWKYETPGEQKFAAKGLHGSKPRQQIIPDAWDCYTSSPVVVGDRVYFGSGDRNVYALDARNGQLVWHFETQGVVHSSPAVADGTLYIGSFDTFLYALDAATGELKWKFKTGEDPVNHNQEGIQSSPTIVDGVVYFGCRDFYLYAVDAKSGQEKWKHKITWINATPAVLDGRVYACTSIPAFFFALDAKTGDEVFKVDLKIPAFSSPALAGGKAYVGSFNGKLYAVDLATHEIVSEFQTAAAKENARGALTEKGEFNVPVIFKSDFFETMFSAVDMLFSIGAILSSPAVDHGVVYFGSADGFVYALE